MARIRHYKTPIAKDIARLAVKFDHTVSRVEKMATTPEAVEDLLKAKQLAERFAGALEMIMRRAEERAEREAKHG